MCVQIKSISTFRRCLVCYESKALSLMPSFWNGEINRLIVNWKKVAASRYVHLCNGMYICLMTLEVKLHSKYVYVYVLTYMNYLFAHMLEL